MNCGERLHGFQVKQIQPVDELEGTLYQLEHEQTGAQLAWLQRPEENKTFMVGFQTLPEDDTGVFHILEHSVLCGSKRFPAKEPFVELLKTSMNTFLNAITFQDKTVYPVSSRNETDFFHLMTVYLDAVFCPAIYENPDIFRQEGWHYELHDGKAQPTYKGVVFNEMKGAFSSVNEVIANVMNRMLFPTSCYRFVSGGDPVHIPELSYEQFLATHKRYYHPSNAKIFLDGDLPIDRVLEVIDRDYLSHYQRQALDFSLTWQEPVARQDAVAYYSVAPTEDTAQKTYFTMGKVVGSWQDKETLIALEVLCDYLAGSNDAPLKRAILERGLGQNVQMELCDHMLQPWLLVQVENTEQALCGEIQSALRETLEPLARDGLDKGALLASLNRLAFRYRERNEPQGVILGLTAMKSWNYGGDPALYLTTEDAFAALNRQVEGDYFPQLLRETLLDEAHLVTLTTLPSPTLNGEVQQAEQRRLADIAAGWDEGQRAEVIAQTAALERWQQTPDSPEALAALPHLQLKEVSPEPERLEPEVGELQGVTLLRHPSLAKGVVYFDLYFALTDCTLEELPPLRLLSRLLGNLPTTHYTASQLRQELKTHLGKLTFGLDVFSRPEADGVCTPCFVVSCSVLEEQVPHAVRLIREVLLETRLDQAGPVREILLQAETAYRQSIIASGNQFAIFRTLSHLTAEGAVREAESGYTCYRWLHETAGAFEDGKDSLLTQLSALSERCFTARRLTLGVAGPVAEADLAGLADSFPAGEAVPQTAAYPCSAPCREGIVIPSQVSYAALGADLGQVGKAHFGELQVLSTILSYQYLWNEVRVQGGAYGTGFRVRENGSITFHSYRDPNGLRSLEVYQAAPEFLEQFCNGGDELEPLIIGAVAATEPQRAPADKAQTIFEGWFRGTTHELRRQRRREMLETTKAGLLALAEPLEQASAQGSVCVIGPDSLFTEAGRADWTLLEL
ncbi:MAG: insulinase family protein [Clostridiales bacterium]|nr:insulinase family protein [Clostridiales bacterium]